MLKTSLRSGAIALALGFCGAASVLAQQSASPAAPAQAAPSQPPMVLPVISPSHLAVARAVVVSSGLSRSFDTIVPELMGQLDLTVTRTRPELASDLKAVLDQLQPEFQAQTNQIINAAAQSVAGEIDEADLKQVETFFESPAGKKYVSAEPEMLTRMMGTIHDISEQMSEHMMTRVREEMKKRGKQL